MIAALLHAAGHDLPAAVGCACRDDCANGLKRQHLEGDYLAL
jgi:hypothetical protein